MTGVTLQRFEGGPSDWDTIIARLPSPHLLQTWEWAQVKEAFGWQPMPLVWTAPASQLEPSLAATGPRQEVLAAAMILKRPVLRRGFAAHLCILYAPKAPLLDWENVSLRRQVLSDLQAFASKERAIFLKMDPDVVLGTGIPGEAASRENSVGQEITADLTSGHWIYAGDQIQFRNTVVVDLTPSEDDILSRMKQKTRYNVRLAAKKGVTVRSGAIADLALLYKMYAETSERDGFVIRDETYYRSVWQTFMRTTIAADVPFAEPLIAEFDGEPVAAIFVFYYAGRAYYLYGMSLEAHREKMPNHLLQWEAMRRAKARGCKSYDLWGAPDVFTENDSMWGVFRFKEGLGGEVVRTLGAWDFPSGRMWYPIYARVVPRVLDIMRARGRQRTRQDLATA